MKALVVLENYVQESGLDHPLIDLVKTRCSGAMDKRFRIWAKRHQAGEGG